MVIFMVTSTSSSYDSDSKINVSSKRNKVVATKATLRIETVQLITQNKVPSNRNGSREGIRKSNGSTIGVGNHRRDSNSIG